MALNKMPKRAVFITEQVQARWVEKHTAHLLARMSRPALYAAWDDACCGMKADGRRARKANLAADLARHDAHMLGEDWFEDPFLRADVDACEQRVRTVGTPTYWAGTTVTADDPCPLDVDGWHVWSEKRPSCFRCGTDMLATVSS